MEGVLKFAGLVAAELVAKIRIFLIGFGGGGVAFFLIQSYAQIYAEFTYEQAFAEAISVKHGCFNGEPDARGIREVVPCIAEDGDEEAAARRTTSIIVFRFKDTAGVEHVAQAKVGNVGAPRDIELYDGFPILYDPLDPKAVEAPIGRSYYALTLPLGLISGVMVFLGLFIGRLVRQ